MKKDAILILLMLSNTATFILSSDNKRELEFIENNTEIVKKQKSETEKDISVPLEIKITGLSEQILNATYELTKIKMNFNHEVVGKMAFDNSQHEKRLTIEIDKPCAFFFILERVYKNNYVQATNKKSLFDDMTYNCLYTTIINLAKNYSAISFGVKKEYKNHNDNIMLECGLHKNKNNKELSYFI